MVNLVKEHSVKPGFGLVCQIAQDRNNLLLGVERTILMRIAVKVNREAWDRDNRSFEINQQ